MDRRRDIIVVAMILLDNKHEEHNIYVANVSIQVCVTIFTILLRYFCCDTSLIKCGGYT